MGGGYAGRDGAVVSAGPDRVRRPQPSAPRRRTKPPGTRSARLRHRGGGYTGNFAGHVGRLREAGALVVVEGDAGLVGFVSRIMGDRDALALGTKRAEAIVLEKMRGSGRR